MKVNFLASCVLALSLLAPATGTAAAGTTRSFDVGALRVERLSDKGPAVILIPGLASGPWVWEDTAKRLASRHSVYLLTLPGFDGRAAVAGATFDTLVRDLGNLIATRHLDRPVLIGHSLGGSLSLIYATTWSATIRGVVAVDGLPVFPGTERMPGDRSALGAQARAQFAGQSVEQFAAGQRAYMARIGVLDEALATRLAERSSRSDMAATGDFMAQALELDLRPKLGDIEVPVVEISPFNAPDFAAMGVDEAGKTAYYRGLLAGVEKLEVVSISPARHFVMFDQPEKFAAALDAALTNMFESKQK